MFADSTAGKYVSITYISHDEETEMSDQTSETTATGHLGDKTVGRIGFGAMQLAGPKVMGPPRDPDEARVVLRRAVELGVDHIDTAQFYGPDTVNDLIRETLHPYPEGLRLVTKVGARRDADGAFQPALSPRELRDAVEDNLRSLKVERMDLVNLRPVTFGPSDEPLTEELGTLVEMRDEGKIDLIGISTVSREVVESALEVTELGEVQNSFSIIDQSDAPTLELCRERGIAYVPYFPLGSAFTGGPKAIGEDPAIVAVAGKHEATTSQVALAWLLAQYENLLLIPGTSSVAHLEENMAVADVALDAEDLATLDGVKQLGDPATRMQH
jgi:aryl-alcohol dehydrogenase-like predicted oxidoreductase